MSRIIFTNVLFGCLAWFLFTTSKTSAAEAGFESAFREANVAYERGDYQGAIEAYRRLIEKGWRSSAVHFNLGNAAYKAGRLGDAIYHYRKSRLLNPRDADAKANLSFARDSLGASPHPGSDNLVLQFFTLGETLAVAFFFFWALFILLAISVVQKRWNHRLRPWWKLAAICFLAATAIAYYAWKGTQPGRVAIAARSEVIARFGPLAESQTAFTIRDGNELAVSTVKEEWVQVSDARGRVAWVPRVDIHLFP